MAIGVSSRRVPLAASITTFSTWWLSAAPYSAMHTATPHSPSAIARGITRSQRLISGAIGVTSSQPTNMNIAMPIRLNTAKGSFRLSVLPNQPSSGTACGDSSPTIPKITSVLHMAKVSTISALPKASMPNALSRPNTITSPTPTIQRRCGFPSGY